MELLLIIIAVYIICCIVISITYTSEFDIKIKEIEDILNSSEARRRKYELFDMLGKLADDCTNYSDLIKLQKLLSRVYDL